MQAVHGQTGYRWQFMARQATDGGCRCWQLGLIGVSEFDAWSWWHAWFG